MFLRGVIFYFLVFSFEFCGHVGLSFVSIVLSFLCCALDCKSLMPVDRSMGHVM
jgi:hypothetical protein